MAKTINRSATATDNTQYSQLLQRDSIWGQKDIWSITLFLVFLLVIFFPPFYRGLFFDENLLPALAVFGFVGIVALVTQLIGKKLVIVRSYVDLAMLLYSLAYVIAITTAVMPRKSIIGAMLVIGFFIVYWMSANLTETERQQRVVSNVLLIGAVATVLVTLDAALGGLISNAIGSSPYPAAFDQNRLFTVWQYPNAGGAYMAAFLAMAVAFFVGSEKYWHRALYMAGAAILAMGIFGTVSKGALLLTAFGLLLLCVLMGFLTSIRKGIIAFLISLVLMVMGAIAWKEFLSFVVQKQYLGGVLVVVALIIISMALVAIWDFIGKKTGEINEDLLKKILIAGTVLALVAIVALGATWKMWMPQDVVDRMNELKDISTNQSLVTRVDFARWAVAIMEDHPVLGTGYGGWQGLYQRYQDYGYWTTETHSHFLQVGVEAGLIGLLAYLAIWLMQVVRIYRLRNRKEALTGLGIGMASMLLFLHSSFDFDFSIPALQLIAWILVGTMGAVGGDGLELTRPARPRLHKIIAGALTILSLLVIFNSLSMWSAKRDADAAVKLINSSNGQPQQVINDNIDAASQLFEKAMKNDPWSADPRINMGNLYAYLYRSTQDPNARALAQKYAQEAESLVQYDSRLSVQIGNVYLNMFDYDGNIRICRLRIEQVPLDGTAYETLAQQLVEAAKASAYQKDIKKAHKYAKEALGVPDLMKKKTAKIDPAKGTYWVGAKPEITLKMKLCLSQAHFILGDYKTSQTDLPVIDKKTEQSLQAKGNDGSVIINDTNIVQAALYEVQGKQGEAQAIVAQVYARDTYAPAKFEILKNIAAANKS
ncbi:MAG: O-antigen ligase family protein [Acidobacteriota bacterium]